MAGDIGGASAGNLMPYMPNLAARARPGCATFLHRNMA